MTREEAISLIKSAQLMLINPTTNEPVSDLYEALEMAIQALSQEPCTVSVSEKEPNEITEEVTLRFFKNSLKVRWHDFVIYNVEWLKKNWQMEMDIVCGVKPCDDAISREWLMRKATERFYTTNYFNHISAMIEEAPSVTQKSGKWINLEKKYKGQTLPFWGRYGCSKCGGYGEGTFNYCPNCGAKMESEDKE